MTKTVANERTADLLQEFDRQFGNLCIKGYPAAAGLSPEAFRKIIEPLRTQVRGLKAADLPDRVGRMPLVIVVTGALIPTESAMALVDIGGKSGFTTMEAKDLATFEPIDHVLIPNGAAYLAIDLDTGMDTLSVTPAAALEIIHRQNRSPLTIDEGVALVTHNPHILRSRNCFSMLGSRCGDRRVTALWVSRGYPRLGWCWAGNPHSWLGSASCGERIGS